MALVDVRKKRSRVWAVAQMKSLSTPQTVVYKKLNSILEIRPQSKNNHRILWPTLNYIWYTWQMNEWAAVCYYYYNVCNNDIMQEPQRHSVVCVCLCAGCWQTLDLRIMSFSFIASCSSTATNYIRITRSIATLRPPIGSRFIIFGRLKAGVGGRQDDFSCRNQLTHISQTHYYTLCSNKTVPPRQIYP